MYSTTDSTSSSLTKQPCKRLGFAESAELNNISPRPSNFSAPPISRIVLETNETDLLKTKINKRIQTEIIDYIDVIKKEKKAVRSTGIAPKQTWTYTLCNVLDITVDVDDEFYDEEDDDE